MAQYARDDNKNRIFREKYWDANGFEENEKIYKFWKNDLEKYIDFQKCCPKIRKKNP